MTIHPPASATWHTVVASALGDIVLVRDATGLRGLYFPHHWYLPDPATFGPRVDAEFEETTEQLAQYLAGERRHFELPLVTCGDPRQRAVWELIAQIPYGDTTSYGELAARIGGVTAQEVGAAVGRNPLSIIVPCHRVVGRNGKLTGYAGGINRKRYLLELEGDYLSQSLRIPFQGSLISGLQ
jgi:methylated-DNA-[protein]-cysteine S-methyltransferase